MTISVSARTFDAATTIATVPGVIDRFDYIDGLVNVVPHVRPRQVPRGAPLVVSGWAAWPSADGAGSITVVIDGTRIVAAGGRTTRADVELTGSDRIAVGYGVTISTEDLLPGPHEVRVYAERTDGVFECGFVPFRIYATVHPELPAVTAPVRIGFDQVVHVASDATVRALNAAVPQGRFALLSGWAVDARTGRAPAGVTATDGAGRRWTAPSALPRMDVQAAHGARDAALGYEIVIPTGALARGRHRVRIAAYGDDGALFAGAIDAAFDVAAPLHHFPFFVPEPATAVPAAAQLTIALGNRAPERAVMRPRTSIDVPRGATLTVDGWALGPGGSAAAEEVYVELSLDGVDVPPHRLVAISAFRCDEPPRALPRPPVEDAWFTTTFTTDGLAARAYRARLIVIDRTVRRAASADLGTLTVRTSADYGETAVASGGGG